MTKEQSEIKPVLTEIAATLAEIKNACIKQHTTAVNNELMTIDEAATLLKLSKSTLYSKASKGTVPVIKRTKRLYFQKDELMKYLKGGVNTTV